jgi:hypothetical protein
MKKRIASHQDSGTVALRRTAHRQWALKPQDLAVSLKIVALDGDWLPYAALGDSLRLSRFEAHAAVQRLTAAGLFAVVEGQPRPVKPALREFVLHGARYAFPPVQGRATVGVPTAFGVSPLKDELVGAADDAPVWPDEKGVARGPMLLPLYEKLPAAAREDQSFHELLALFDALRVGRARERSLAVKFLEQRIR